MQTISEREAAKLLKITERELQSLRFRGLAPAFQRVGRRTVRYRLASIQGYLDSHALDTGERVPKPAEP